MFKYGFQVVPRVGVAVQAKIVIELRKKRAAATLVTCVVLLRHFRLVGQAKFVQSLRRIVGPRFGSDSISIHLYFFNRVW